MQDIRKWFVKPHAKGNGNAPKAETKEDPALSKAENPAEGGQESSGRRKTSKYFAASKQDLKDEREVEDLPTKRKSQRVGEEKPAKKAYRIDDDDDDDFVSPSTLKNKVTASPNKKLKSSTGRGVARKAVDIEEGDEEDVEGKNVEIPVKHGGRGRCGRGSSVAGGRGKHRGRGASTPMDIDEDNRENIDDEATDISSSAGNGRGGRGGSSAPAAGRGRGGGRGGFMNFGERKDPPHKGEKEVPEGAPDSLNGLTFVISGTLDSLEREEAEDLIKRHGGRVTGSVSKKTNYLLCDEDIGGNKSAKAKQLGTPFLTEDGLFDIIRASQANASNQEEPRKTVEKGGASVPKSTPKKVEAKKDYSGISPKNASVSKGLSSGASPAKRKGPITATDSLPWTEKYRPKVPNDIIGNQSLVKQLHDWLLNWNKNFLHTDDKKKSRTQSDSSAKKAVLLSGTPGIGKTTSAKLVSQMLGFQAIEVNASDNRGKADSHIHKGIGGSTANSVKELVSNVAMSTTDWSKHPKSVLIMDEVDGMSAGDRGGVADLIASIKTSKIPIICICNDRYSQKLKSLVNHCLLLSFRKPTKQQMAKRLLQVASAEGLQVNEIALEELAERVNGDMRMALNQLQYMSLSMSVIKYDDIRQRLLNSSKDEDISPFTAVDKLFGFNGGKLRMDERIDLSMSDPDLVPLIVQENYMNYRPSLAGKDDNGMRRLKMIARAAESIGDGDIINVQIRRYRQWQLSQSSCLASCIIPAALLHGQREVLEQGERNFNRFGGWLGKNSTIGKNYRLLRDLHYHVLASGAFNLGRDTLRADYLNLVLKQLTDPLRVLPKDEAVQNVVEFMDCYSISPEDYETVVELSKYQKHPNPLEGIPAPVKAALTKAYKQSTSLKKVADMITLPGIKKAPKKRVAAILEPAEDELAEEKERALVETEEENSSDAEDIEGGNDGEKQLQMDLQSLSSKGIQVQVDLKDSGKTSGKKAPAGRGKGGATAAAEKKGGRGSGSASKRKR